MKALGFLVVSLLLLALVHVAYTITDSHLTTSKNEVVVDKDDKAGEEQDEGPGDAVSELAELAHSRRKDLRDIDSGSVLSDQKSANVLLVEPVLLASRKRTHRHIKGRRHHHRHHHGPEDVLEERLQAEKIQQGELKQELSPEKETVTDDRLIKPEDIMMGDQPVIDTLELATATDEEEDKQQEGDKQEKEDKQEEVDKQEKEGKQEEETKSEILVDEKAQRKLERKNKRKEMRKKKKQERINAKQEMKTKMKEAKEERKAKRKEEKREKKKRKETNAKAKEQRKAQRKNGKSKRREDKLEPTKENKDKRKEQRRADRKASRKNAKYKQKEEKAIRKEERRAQRDSKRREKKMKRKENKMDSFVPCKNNEDCAAGSCCLKKKTGMFCKAHDMDMDARCKEQCQCKSGLICYKEAKKWGRVKRFGKCAPSIDVTTQQLESTWP